MGIIDDIRAEATEEFLREQEEKFESRSVKLVLKLLGRGSQFRNHTYSLRDHPSRYTFDTLRQVFPEFPLVVHTSRQRMYRLGEDPSLQPSKFFRRFGKSRLLAEYEVARENLAPYCDVPVGLLAPLAGYQDGVLMHDAPAPFATGSLWAFRRPDGRIYWVELFREVVKAIGSTWTAQE